MRYNRTDIISVRYLCAVGLRSVPSFFGEETDHTWEVYARLSNGSDFIFASEGTRQEAEECLRHAYHDFLQAGIAFVPTLEDAHVNVMRIARLYIDDEGNRKVALCEDGTGTSYRLLYGDEEEVVAHIRRISTEIAMLLSQQEL